MSELLERAQAEVDETNRRDPHLIETAGGLAPAELIYGQRMSAWLEHLSPDASDELKLAVRAQHIGRFALPRGEFPDGRVGYKRWRSELARRHAAAAGEIAARVGFSAEATTRVCDLVLKKGLATDPETQLLEDVACLVFLEHYFADFATKHERAKLVDIVRKTWRKMTARGRQAALGLPLGAVEAEIVGEAIAGGAVATGDEA